MKLKRTHNCGSLNINSVDNEIVLSGWVDSKRNLGGLTFIVLRDRYGITQLFFDPDKNSLLDFYREYF